MTKVQCLLKNCRSCLNEMCTRRTVQVIGTKCLDFSRRRSQFRNVTTTVQCDQKQCGSNRNGICGMETLVMRADGCCTKVNNYGGTNGGRKNKSGGEVSTGH